MNKVNFRFAGRFALRYLWNGRVDRAITIITIIAVLGVAVGVATINVVMAVMTGFETTFKEKILGSDAHIIVRKAGGFSNLNESRALIEKVKGVESVSPFVIETVLVATKEFSSGILIKGVEPGSDSWSQVAKSIVLGNIKEQFSLPPLIIGLELANRLGVGVGSAVSLLSSKTTISPMGIIPKSKRFQVVGIFRGELSQYESGMAFAPLEVLAKTFGEKHGAGSGFEVRVTNIDKAHEIADAITTKFAGDRKVYAESWMESNKAFFAALQLEKRVYFIVLLLIVVMASFSIISALVMTVVEKRGDIGVLLTLGLDNRSVKWIFIMQGGIIGLIGVFLGTTLGLVGAFTLKKIGFPIDPKIFQMAELPIHISAANVTLVAISAFLICALSTLYPATRAQKIKPAEILRMG